MSATKERLPLARARWIAEAVCTDLKPFCTRIEIAGSIRRRVAEVGDVEICAIAKRRQNLLGEADQSELDGKLAEMVSRRMLIQIKGGDKYKQFEIVHAACKLDLFICTQEHWGVNFTLRTGPAEFSHKLVMSVQNGGYCPSHLRFSGARIRSWSEPVKWFDTPEEADVFRVLGLPWREPWDR